MQYRKASLLMFCVSVFTIIARQQPVKSVFLGQLQFSRSVTKAPSMKILYKGNMYNIEVDEINQGIGHTAQFQLPEFSSCRELFIIVTQDLKRPTENNFTNFKTSAHHKFRLFRLKRYKFAQDDKEGKSHLYESWKIEEYDRHEGEIDLPDNTLIVLVDPQWIDALQEAPVKNGELLQLPRICFIDEMTQKDMEKIGNAMEFSLVNLTPFHTQPGKRVLQVAHNHIISLDYDTNSAHG